MNYPRAGLYGQIRGNGFPFVVNGELQPMRIAQAAMFTDVILDAAGLAKWPAVLAGLLQANPALRVWAYVCHGVAWNNGSNDVDAMRYQVAQQTDGWLYKVDDNGQPLPHDGNITMSNTPCQQWSADVVADHVRLLLTQGVHGIVLDVSCPGVYNVFGQKFDLARMGFPFDPNDQASMNRAEADFSAAWSSGHRAFYTRLRADLPTVPIVGNCGSCGPQGLTNGWMRENFPKQNAGPLDDPWYANMFHNQWQVPGYLASYCAPMSPWIMTNPSGDGPTGAESKRRMRYGLGSACLGEGAHSFYRGEWDDEWVVVHLSWQFAEYNYPPHGIGWLGEAIAPHTVINGLYVRWFQHGVVLVNPTSNPISWRGDGNSYAPPGEAAKQQWNVPAYDGRLMRRV